MTILFHGFTTCVSLGVLLLLAAASAVASEDFTCISSDARSIKRDKRNFVTRQSCRTLCESKTSCSGYHFDLRKARCTITYYINSKSNDSKSCMRSTKISEGLPNKRYACNNGRTATFKNISEADCDQHCGVKGECDSYIYHSKTKRCITITRKMQSDQKILRQGERKKGARFLSGCFQISKGL